MPARLVFDGAGAAHKEVTLDGAVTFGRSPESDYVLAEGGEAVSSQHASIRNERGRYTIRDEGSTRGTFVNRRRVAEQQLRDGDVIEFGLDGPTARFESSHGKAIGKATPPRQRPALGFFRRLLARLRGR